TQVQPIAITMCATIMKGKCALASSGARNRLMSFAYSCPSRTWCTTKPRTIAVTNTATTDKTNVLFMSPPACGAPLAGAAGAHHTSRHGRAHRADAGALAGRSIQVDAVAAVEQWRAAVLHGEAAAYRDRRALVRLGHRRDLRGAFA